MLDHIQYAVLLDFENCKFEGSGLFFQAGVESKIDLRLQSAITTLGMTRTGIFAST